jgi:hypothetical protein
MGAGWLKRHVFGVSGEFISMRRNSSYGEIKAFHKSRYREIG